jgi:hypothetical protein
MINRERLYQQNKKFKKRLKRLVPDLLYYDPKLHLGLYRSRFNGQYETYDSYLDCFRTTSRPCACAMCKAFKRKSRFYTPSRKELVTKAKIKEQLEELLQTKIREDK